MKNPVQLTKSIDPVRNSCTRSSWRSGFLIPLALLGACFALAPDSRAVDPPPDGGYPGNNTAEGEDALFSLDTREGLDNTAVGFEALYSNTIGDWNTVVGSNALHSNTTGYSNTAVGADALLSNTTGILNVAVGPSALANNTTGEANVAVGPGALESNIDGYESTAIGFLALDESTGAANTAVGSEALGYNTTGVFNTAVGYLALFNNTTGSYNTATGDQALAGDPIFLSTGSYNTANGSGALYSYTAGNFNTASGYQALYSNTEGGSNTACGFDALHSNTTGGFNAAHGANALQFTTTGGGNVANGGFALYINTTGSNNVAAGFDALFNNTTGSNNIAIGPGAGANLTTGNNNIDIGNAGVAGEARRIRIGTAGTHLRSFIAGIRGVTTQNANAIPVLIDSAGQLGTTSSSRRFKKEIKPMDQTSEAILGLKPVTFHYKSDSEGTPQFGLIAEEVAQVNPDLVVRDDNGEIYTVRYEAVNAMLLNEFLKEHRKVEALESKMAKQESTNADQQKVIQALTASLREQAIQIRKVSAELALSKAEPRVVSNDP